MGICLQVRTSVCACVHLCMTVCACMWLCVLNVWMCVRVRVGVTVCVRAYMFTHMGVFVCSMCACVYMYVQYVPWSCGMVQYFCARVEKHPTQALVLGHCQV